MPPPESGADSRLFHRLTSAAERALAAHRLPEALRLLTRAVVRFPHHAGLRNNLACAQLEAGLVTQAREQLETSLRAQADLVVFSNLLRVLLFDPSATSDHVLEWSREYDRVATTASTPRFRGARQPKRVLRIGYISDGFRAHPCAGVLMAVLQHHTRAFRVFCYNTSGKADAVTRQLRRAGGEWRDLSGCSDQEAADRIAADRIDILVETSGHHGPNRIPVLAWRPAPVQVSLFSYPATLGLRAVDCRITDGTVDPPGTEPLYLERKLVRLPPPATCYIPPARPRVNRLPMLERGYITFAAFHRLAKISAPTIDMWSEVLRRLPDAQVVLHHTYGGATRVAKELRQPLETEFARRGILPRRFTWVGALPVTETMKLYNECDLGLDTYPFSGSATTREALWMGVPVVTLAGDRAVSRYSASYLQAAGLSGWIADTPRGFVDRAVSAAKRPELLRKIRRELRPRLLASDAMDARKFVRRLESAYRELWRERNEG